MRYFSIWFLLIISLAAWFGLVGVTRSTGGTIFPSPARSLNPSPAALSRLQPANQINEIRFAVIGDYGVASSDEAAVAALVKSWSPDFIITTGDNNYPSGAAETIDGNIGQYYGVFIYPYLGSYGLNPAVGRPVSVLDTYPYQLYLPIVQAPIHEPNRFFPVLGNHDWLTSGAMPYLEYFNLPDNERYYDFVRGPVHFFALDSDSHEPDGISSDSIQAGWLQNSLAASSSCWNLVYLHHAPYSSGPHGSNPVLQWPYQNWGTDTVLAGHDHDYERIVLNGLPYFVNGLGGHSRYSFQPTPVAGSEFRYNDNFGAMRVTASQGLITYEFITVDGTVVDTYVQSGGCL